MNIGTHFDYNNHIGVYKHGSIQKEPPIRKCTANGSEFVDLAFLNVAATFRQCLSPIVSKLSTQVPVLYIGRWGLATIDQLLTVCLFVEKL